MGKTFKRQKRSLLNVPSAMPACKSRFVAAITRNICLDGSSPPTRSNSCSCRTHLPTLPMANGQHRALGM